MSYNTLLKKDAMSYLEKNNKEQFSRVNIVLNDFLKGRKNSIPRLNRSGYQNLTAKELSSYFVDTLVLAGGAESNYIKQEYKTLLIQLTFQLCFLVDRIHPGSPESLEARNDLNSCYLDIMMDVETETKLLAAFFAELDPLLDTNGKPPAVANPLVNADITFWSIDDIAFVLDNLEELGVNFKAFLKSNNISI